MKKVVIPVVTMLCSFFTLAQQTQITVVIDPGHGGSDPGHISGYEGHKSEKEINLILAKKFGEQISSQLKNVNIVYTRTEDTYPTLDERVAIATNNKADYFISLHCNASHCKKACGTETHVHLKNQVKSVELAREIEKEFVAHAGRPSRGVKDTEDREYSLHVLRENTTTSVLVECGFLSNETEGAFLNSEKGQQLISEAVFRGFKRFIVKEHPQISFTKTPDVPVVAKTTPKEGNATNTNASNKTSTSTVKTTTNKTTTTKTTSVAKSSYTIQIMSSKLPVQTDHTEFKRIGLPVSRDELNTSSSYKYRYTAGNYTSMEEAQKDLEKVQQNGFKDAYIVKKNSN
jgi:N-acetylmuramoyl-L-alanine amidase